MTNYGNPADIVAIDELTREHVKAMAEKNVARLVELNTDGVIYLPPGNPPIEGRVAVKSMFEMFFAQFSVVEQIAQPSEIHVCGDRAFAWGPEALRLTTHAGQVIEMRGHGMSIMERQSDGSWKFSRGINNLSPVRT